MKKETWQDVMKKEPDLENILWGRRYSGVSAEFPGPWAMEGLVVASDVDPDLVVDLKNAVSKLTVYEATLLRLHVMDGQTFASIGQVLGLGMMEVFDRYREIRSKLASFMEGWNI